MFGTIGVCCISITLCAMQGTYFIVDSTEIKSIDKLQYSVYENTDQYIKVCKEIKTFLWNFF